MRVATPPSPMAFAAAASTWTTSREVGLLEAEDEEQAAYGLDENFRPDVRLQRGEGIILLAD